VSLQQRAKALSGPLMLLLHCNPVLHHSHHLHRYPCIHLTPLHLRGFHILWTAAAAGPQLSFDPETAFKVLRSAGYAQHALFVAEQAEQPEWILDVLLEDMGSYPEALAFIGGLSQTV
jgi:hypothetical protein